MARNELRVQIGAKQFRPGFVAFKSHMRPWLGWLGFGCSSMLPTLPTYSAKCPSAQAELGRQWNINNQSQPSPGLRPDESLCTSTKGVHSNIEKVFAVGKGERQPSSSQVKKNEAEIFLPRPVLSTRGRFHFSRKMYASRHIEIKKESFSSTAEVGWAKEQNKTRKNRLE